MKAVVALLYLLISVAYSANTTLPSTKVDLQTQAHIEQLKNRIDVLTQAINSNNIWSKIYSNYKTYKELEYKKAELLIAIKKQKRSTKKGTKEGLETLRANLKTIKGKLQLLEEYKNDPFKKLLTPPEIGEIPTIGNPFAIIGALSFRKRLSSDHQEYLKRFDSLQNLIEKLKHIQESTQELRKIDKSFSYRQREQQKALGKEITTLTSVSEIFKTTHSVYSKKIDEILLDLDSNISKEIHRTLNMALLVALFVLMLFGLKYLVRRYMSDNDRFYIINKALNITFIFLLVLTLLFTYIENVSYLVTILGFASAGIAIAMKDWFMSLIGWLTIVIGGAIHVGDRVKFTLDGVEYVGDVVDISLLRMTIHEDVTLTSYMTNRRAGRIIFVPNNFVFTNMIANYSHAGLKTVWDGIDVVITFDSDLHKASEIAKEVVRKYAKGYTDSTRKQLNRLRSHYGIRNMHVEPRILTFIEPYGVKVSAWYLTNAYGTLTLRSTISAEIVVRLNQEPSVQIAYPTQSLQLSKTPHKPPFENRDEA